MSAPSSSSVRPLDSEFGIELISEEGVPGVEPLTCNHAGETPRVTPPLSSRAEMEVRAM